MSSFWNEKKEIWVSNLFDNSFEFATMYLKQGELIFLIKTVQRFLPAMSNKKIAIKEGNSFSLLQNCTPLNPYIKLAINLYAAKKNFFK